MDKTSRPVRNRRHSRRAWPPGEIHRPQKRLFTPEIKRMLKDWLVRRRDNPYPSREEKKALAIRTGLTYIQICNWFANWRRKLKNAGREPQKKTWGHLIKNYNTSANGNVEQFSICSGDSIWGDEERVSGLIYDHHHHHMMLHMDSSSPPMPSPDYHGGGEPSGYANSEYYDRYCGDGELVVITKKKIAGMAGAVDVNCDSEKNRNLYANYYTTDGSVMIEHSYGPKTARINAQEQCFQISSTTNHNHNNHYPKVSGRSVINTDAVDNQIPTKPAAITIFPNAKYKNNIMEKYLRGLDCPSNNNNNNINKTDGMELSKWLESAANFTPKKNNYIEWDTAARNKAAATNYANSGGKSRDAININHQKEELEAAEVLTSLAGNYRNRMYFAAAANGCASPTATAALMVTKH